jgi:hypothetical protein
MTITIKKRGYWCLRVVYTSCQGLESDGRNFLAAIVLLRAKKVGHQISVSFEKFDVVQALLSFFFDTIPADSLRIYFILLFSFSKYPLLLIKVDFDWNFTLNKYSLRAYLQSFPTTYNT